MTTTPRGPRARLRRDLLWLKGYALVSSVVVVGLLVGAARAPSTQDELTVERINVVDPTGVTRVVIANAERFPLPRLDGKEYPRAVQPAGLVSTTPRATNWAAWRSPMPTWAVSPRWRSTTPTTTRSA